MQQATVSRSASICVICTPVSCQYLGRIRISGRKKMPCLAEDRKVAVQYFPMDWNSMLAMTLMGSSTRDTHWQRSAKAPISITAASSLRNSIMICGASRKPTADNTASIQIPTVRENRKDSRTRPYFFAP